MDKPTDGPLDALAHDTPLLASTGGAAPFLSLLDNSADGVIFVDSAGRCVAANQAAKRLLGYERDDWQTRDLNDVVVGGPSGSTLAGRQGSGLRRIRRKDGSLVSAEVWLTGVESLSGAALLIFFRPWGDWQRPIEGDEDASETRIVFDVTLEGAITDWNRAAERMYGFGAREVIGQSIAKLAPTESIGDVASLLDQVRGGEQVSSFHTSQQTKHGCRIDVCLGSLPYGTTAATS